MGTLDKPVDKPMVRNVDDLNGDLSKSRVDFYSGFIHINSLIKSDSYLNKADIHTPTTTTIYLYIVKDKNKKAG